MKRSYEAKRRKKNAEKGKYTRRRDILVEIKIKYRGKGKDNLLRK